MDTNQSQKPEQKKNNWDLISGILLTLFGSYRLYSHYFTDIQFSNLRLGLTFVIVGFGIYNLYKFFIRK
jgi:uncharacterized membrane protein HdeD (DUF308 family)